MEAVAFAVSLALLSLVPQLGAERAKAYGALVARESVEAGIDPWTLVALGRIETNWNADNLGACCGGLMSIHWRGWARYAERHGLASTRPALRELARDPARNLRLAAEAVATHRRNCGPRSTVYLSAYQSGQCRQNAYGRRVARVVDRYRVTYAPAVSRYRHGPSPRIERAEALVYTLGAPASPELATTRATVASGP